MGLLWELYNVTCGAVELSANTTLARPITTYCWLCWEALPLGSVYVQTTLWEPVAVMVPGPLVVPTRRPAHASVA